MWLVATNHHSVQHKYKIFATPQKILLDSAYLEAKATSSKWKLINK